MDPVTAVGLGLSITSLAFQLFAGCITAYQTMIDAVDMPKEFEHLKIRMQLEQSRLLNWGEKVGLLSDSLETPSATLRLHRNLIFDLLLEIQRLFQSCLKIDAKFGGPAVTPTTNEIEHGRAITGSSTQEVRGTKRLLNKTLRTFQKVQEVPKRLQWAMIEHDRFERLVEQLISYNDSIVSLLDTVNVQQIHEMQVQSGLTLLQLSSQVDELKQLMLAMQIGHTGPRRGSERPGQDASLSSSLQAIEPNEAEPSLMDLAGFKRNQIGLDSGVLRSSTARIDANAIQLRDTDAARTTATYIDQQVWIEWKEEEEHEDIPLWTTVIESRVEKLAALLGMKDKPAAFHTPYCLGYLHDSEDETVRYGFMYSLPDSAPVDSAIVSLLDLICRQEKPSLTQRVRLSVLLASSVMYLHSVNWLHKSIRSENVVFFRGLERVSIDYGNPTITGFEYARPDLPDEMTEKPTQILEHDVYRHPSAMEQDRSRSRKSWDIYSLGVILVEIALWQSILDITNIDRNDRMAKSKAKRARETLLGASTLNKIGTEMGERFRDVVQCCLTGASAFGIPEDTDESTPEAGADLLAGFSRQVVTKLQSIQV